MKKINDALIGVAQVIEKIIAIILLAVVMVAVAYLVKDILGGFGANFDTEFLSTILANAFNIIIIIEFVRVLIKHSMDTVVETLIYALARGLIVGKEEIWEMVITIVAIALLLAARKYLFIAVDYKTVSEEDIECKKRSSKK